MIVKQKTGLQCFNSENAISWAPISSPKGILFIKMYNRGNAPLKIVQAMFHK